MAHYQKLGSNYKTEKIRETKKGVYILQLLRLSKFLGLKKGHRYVGLMFSKSNSNMLKEILSLDSLMSIVKLLVDQKLKKKIKDLLYPSHAFKIG